jgi:uncharacterized protein
MVHAHLAIGMLVEKAAVPFPSKPVGAAAPRPRMGMEAAMSHLTSEDGAPVATIGTVTVKAGREEAFEQWLHATAAAAMQFEGHLGLDVIRPRPGSHEYTFVFRYGTPAQLEAWLTSDVRSQRLKEVEPLCEEAAKLQQLTGLEAWFTLPDRPLSRPPPRHKMALVTLFAVFPTISALNALVVPQLSALHPLVRTLVVCVATVAILTYAVMPLLTRLLFSWLYPPRARRMLDRQVA